MLTSQRHLFEIPRDIAYLNNASYTPLPRSVRAAGEAGVATKSMPWTMESEASIECSEAVRAAAARFIGATADDIAIVPAAAYGVATAAANLAIPEGSRILLADGEFPSQSLEWARQAELRAAVQSPSSGRLAPALRAQGAAIVVDATQAVGVMPIDVGAIGADYLVFPTYKWLLGPYTLAFLYAAPARQDGTPLEQHGANRVDGARPFAGGLGEPIPTARRFDMGQRLNPVSLPMALAGMQLLHGWGRAEMTARMRWLTDAIAAEAEAAGWTPVPAALRAPHILGLRPPPGLSAAAALEALAGRGVYVAERGGVLRVGAHVHNDEEDVARFSEALRGLG